jgi:hypothetical protein
VPASSLGPARPVRRSGGPAPRLALPGNKAWLCQVVNRKTPPSNFFSSAISKLIVANTRICDGRFSRGAKLNFRRGQTRSFFVARP